MRAEELDKTFGVWEVSTENDVEGRSARELGTYKGYIDEIALHLADKAFYTLCFSPYRPAINQAGVPTQQSVSVVLDGFMIKDNPVKEAKALFANRPVEIGDSNYFKSFTISASAEVKKQIALGKLTDDEKKLLGLGHGRSSRANQL